MNKLKIVLAVAALAVAGSVSAQDINAIYTQAAEAFNAKNYAAAIPLFEQVIAEGIDVEGAEALVAGAKQNLPDGYYRIGGAAFVGGRLDEALASFTKAAELAELYGNATVLTKARQWIGNTVSKQGADAFNNKDYATAAAIFQPGYDANPNNTALGLNLALSYSGLKEFDKSAPIYAHIISLSGMGEAFAKNAAVARENWSLDVLEQAGANAQAGNYQAVIDATDALLAAISDDAAVHWTRLQAYNSMKNNAKVAELGESAAAAQTTDVARSNVWFMVGTAYGLMQNYPQAIAAFGKVTAGDNVAAAKAQITELQKAL